MNVCKIAVYKNLKVLFAAGNLSGFQNPTGLGKILKKQDYRVSKREKIGGYEQPSSTNAIESYSSFTSADGSILTSLIVKENITLKRVKLYFFGDEYNTFLPANKKNLLRLYPKNKAQLQSYLNKNEVDFNSEADLKKLIASLEPGK